MNQIGFIIVVIIAVFVLAGCGILVFRRQQEGARLEPEGVAWLSLMVAEYRVLRCRCPCQPAVPAAGVAVEPGNNVGGVPIPADADLTCLFSICDEIAARLNPDSHNSSSRLKTRDLSDFELTLQAIQARCAPEDLRRKLPSLRQRYLDAVGDSVYAAYVASSPPNVGTASDAEILADCNQLLSELVRSTYAVSGLESLKTELTMTLLGATLIICILAIATCYWFISYGGSTLAQIPDLLATARLAKTLCVALGFGALGGAVSVLRRMKGAASDEPSLTSISQLRSGRWDVYLAPISGAIFAALLFWITESGLVSGTVFPQYLSIAGQPKNPDGTPQPKQPGSQPLPNSSEKTGSNQDDVWLSTATIGSLGPKHLADFGKLVVWSFAAGFVERVVPNVINRLVDNVQNAAPKPVAPALPPPVTLASIAIAPTSIPCNTKAVGTVTLMGNAPADITVNLTSEPGLTVPLSVTVPAGKSTAQFGVTAGDAAVSNITITATAGITRKTAVVQVVAQGA
jgi:hypothetical protein